MCTTPSTRHRGDVAGVQPAVGVDRRGGCARRPAVARHRRRGADQQLAGLARRQVGAVGQVDDPRVHPGEQHARGAGDDRGAEPPDRPARDHLRHAPALQHRAAHAVGGGLLHGGTERGGTAADEAQRPQVRAVDGGVLGQGEDDRRDHDRGRDAVALDQLEELLDVEARHRHQRGAGMQRRVRHHAEAHGVEERCDGEHPVVAAERDRALLLQHVRHAARWVSITPLGSPLVPLE